MTEILTGVLGLILIGGSLQDAFEVVLLPRRVQRRLRLMRLFFRATWGVWSRLGARLPPGARREGFLSVYGPLSMVMLFTLWAVCLITGFAALQWAMFGSDATLASWIFASGEAFFTLGYGDAPQATLSRLLTIMEAGTGFGFIALTIGYLPVLYQHFSQRDVQLIQLAPRAGSPASSAVMLLRFAAEAGPAGLEAWLRNWELWAAEIAESHSSYPMLASYRSQHRDHSWLASLSIILDTCTLMIGHADPKPSLQACATFSAARRALDEISGSFGIVARTATVDGRFPSPAQIAHLFHRLADLGVAWTTDRESESAVETLRASLRASFVGPRQLSPASAAELDELRRAPREPGRRGAAIGWRAGIGRGAFYQRVPRLFVALALPFAAR